MADVHSPEIRSYNMSHIRSKDTKPEEIVRKYLFHQGFRYRKNVASLPGKPDIVLPRYHVCVFVNGCFWHKHDGCKYFKWPQSNVEFWRKKIESNVLRDQKEYQALHKLGWETIVVWECELRRDIRSETLEKLKERLIDRKEIRSNNELDFQQ